LRSHKKSLKNTHGRSLHERHYRAIDDSGDPAKEVPCFLHFVSLLLFISSLPRCFHTVSLPAWTTTVPPLDRIKKKTKGTSMSARVDEPVAQNEVILSPWPPRKHGRPVAPCRRMADERRRKRREEKRDERDSDEQAHVTPPIVHGISAPKGRSFPVSQPVRVPGPVLPSFFRLLLNSFLPSFTPLHSPFSLSLLLSLSLSANADPHRLRSGMPCLAFIDR